MDNNQDNMAAMEAELKTRFGLLPKEIQDVITSSDYQAKLFEISKKYKMTYEQLGALEFNTTLCLVGLLSPADYEKTVTADVGKKDAEMAPIIADVKDQVFNAIHSKLTELYSTTDTEDSDSAEQTKEIFAKSGISIGAAVPKTTPTASTTENRSDILKGIENPTKSNPLVLNEKPAVAPVAKPIGAAGIPVPRAPYAAPAPAAQTKAPTPMTAQPAGSIVDSKLGGSFNMAAKDSDHSIKKVTPAAPPAPKGGDSYREPIE